MVFRQKLLWIGAALVFVMAIMTGCSSDGVTVATYTDGKKNYEVKVKDVKDELMQYVNYNPVIVGDALWHSDYIFSRYIALELAYFDQLAKGITNQQDFKDVFDSQYKKQNLIVLFRKGQEILNDEAKNAKYEYVKASHVLLMTSRQTNINGQLKELSESQFKKLMAEKEQQANDIIAQLKASKNMDSEFSNTAVLRSEDGGSSSFGGDVGYFTRGIMVKEFEDAAFGADKKGLIEKPVKTSYGYHIIYIKEPVKKGTMKDIERAAGKQSYQRMEPYFRTSYYKMNKSSSIKDFYTIDTNKKALVIDGKNQDLKQLGDDLKIFSVYGKVYTWKECKEIFEAMIPNFIKEMNLQGFEEQMENLKNFIQFVEIARTKGYEKSPKYLEEMQKQRKDITKTIAAQFFQKDFMQNIKKEITDKAVADYYTANKSTFVKSIDNKVTPLSYKEAMVQARDDLEKKMTQDFYKNWSEEAKKKYKVLYSKGGLQTLENMEKNIMKEIQKKQAEAQKKAQRSGGGQPQPQQQQQIQINPQPTPQP